MREPWLTGVVVWTSMQERRLQVPATVHRLPWVSAAVFFDIYRPNGVPSVLPLTTPHVHALPCLRQHHSEIALGDDTAGGI